MKATLAKSEGYERTLEITVEPEKVKQSYEKVLGKFTRELTVPGFRKGKAPRNVAERHMRPEFLQQNVLEDVGLHAYHHALEEHHLEPLSNPRVEWVQFDKDKEMVFRATFDVKPEIEAPEYKGKVVGMPQTEVSEDDVDAVLTSEQEKRTTLGAVEEDRPLEMGDIATVNFESFEEGKPVEGGKAENLLVEINDDFVMPGFARHVVGMKRDEERQFTDSFPQDYKNPALAGKTVEFKFKLLDIKKKIVPEITDEFARQVSRYGSLEELKTEIRRQLTVELHSAVGNKALETIIPEVKVQLPQSLLARTSQQILQEWDKQLKQVGSNLDQFFKNQRWTQQQLSQELYPRAYRIAVAELIADAIARTENITVTDEELDTEIDRFAKMTNQDTAVVKEHMNQDGTADQLRDNLLRRKVLEHIYENVKVEKEEPPAEEPEKAAEGESAATEAPTPEPQQAGAEG